MESLLSEIRVEIKLITADQIRSRIESLVDALDVLRQDGAITNDAYLDAGAIHGGLMMLSNLIEVGIDRTEVKSHMEDLISRAQRVEEVHPGLMASVDAAMR
ncbi:MAG TPA: hypothetical protein HA345_01630 [Candidatus Thalassarchaeaceae archaeon]|nr:MAG TPA: hypothetical protein D7H94_01620 [Candidatus Poseidoniales archaeon]HIH84088.1 hypothetical protein [Candidatus Thalassarchaeaceae archaeon]|tara:strand:- start:3553 stop:3858 length:306 start_codon:yes stop_codon:yes gene_type:complete